MPVPSSSHLLDGDHQAATLSRPTRPCVLVFAGADPSGGAGLQADLQAIAAQGCHALTVVTAITVQDHNRVRAVYPLPAWQVRAQAEQLISSIPIAAFKVGVIGTIDNAKLIAEVIERSRQTQALPVVVDTVLASGAGDALNQADDLTQLFTPLYAHTTLLTPNVPESLRLQPATTLTNPLAPTPSFDPETAARYFLSQGCEAVLIKGEHEGLPHITNRLYQRYHDTVTQHDWQTARLPGTFHGTGCTLAAAIAGQLAQGHALHHAVAKGLQYCTQTLEQAYTIGAGQAIPHRSLRGLDTSASLLSNAIAP